MAERKGEKEAISQEKKKTTLDCGTIRRACV